MWLFAPPGGPGPDPSGSLGDIGGRLDGEPRGDAPRASEPAASRGDPRRHEVSQSPPSRGRTSAASGHCLGASAAGPRLPGMRAHRAPAGHSPPPSSLPGLGVGTQRVPAPADPRDPAAPVASSGVVSLGFAPGGWTPWKANRQARERGAAGGAGGAGSPSRQGEPVGGWGPAPGPPLARRRPPDPRGRAQAAPPQGHATRGEPGAPRGFPRTLRHGLCRRGGACGCPAGRQAGKCLLGQQELPLGF